MGHQVIKLQNPLKTLGFLQFYRFKTVKDRIIKEKVTFCKYFFLPQVKNPRFPAPAPFAPQNKL